MEPTIVMNTTSTGLMNISTQTGSIGSIFGMAILVGLLVGAFGSMHSWNTKGLLYRLVKFLIKNVGENVLYGAGTSAVIGGIYYVGTEMSKFGEANPRFLLDVLVFCGQAVLVVAFLAILGYATKPIWNFAIGYAQGEPTKKAKQ